MKTCTKCGEEKPLDEFHRDSGRPDGRRAHCKACTAEYHRENREWRNALISKQQRKRQRSSKYGIAESVGLELRDRPCDVCGAEYVDGKGGHAIDHCHETGAVRGTLCGPCNKALGGFRDSPELLTRAIHYLTRGADYRAVDREA